VLKNPFYAGAYAYGKGEKRTEIVDGRARKSYGHRKPLEEWEVLLKDHHDGYIRDIGDPRLRLVRLGNDPQLVLGCSTGAAARAP